MTTYTMTPEELKTLLEAAANMGAKVGRFMKAQTVAQSPELQAWTRQQLATREAWEAAQARKSAGPAVTYPGTKTIVK